MSERAKAMHQKRVKIEPELLWCNTCKKSFPAYFIRIKDTKWIFINPHEHDLTIGICPRTAWITTDLKENKFPQLMEVFKLCEDVTKLKEVLGELEKLEKEAEKLEKEAERQKALEKLRKYHEEKSKEGMLCKCTSQMRDRNE